MTTIQQVEDGARSLAARDPVAADLHRRFGAPPLPAPRTGGFESLVRAITYQQLAGAAASAIYTRVRALVDGPLTPESVAGLEVAALRAAGLSGSKTRAILDLAEHAADGRVAFRGLSRHPDEEVVEALVQVWGVGEWTAQMFLITQLRRLDVWPTGDLGVRKGYALAWGLEEMPTPEELQDLGARFHPYRTIIARWCWQTADTPTPG